MMTYSAMSEVLTLHERRVKTRIAHWRKRRNLTQEDLAAKLNVSQSSITSWESGRRDPDLEILDALAEVLQCSVPDLIDDQRLKEVPIVGKIGAGNIVYAIEGSPAEGYTDSPPRIEWRVDLCCLIVDGSSQEPMMFEGWQVFFYNDDRTQGGCSNLSSRTPHVVWLKDGRWLVKLVRKGYTAGKYNLHTLNSPDIIEDVEIDWCAPIAAIIPK